MLEKVYAGGQIATTIALTSLGITTLGGLMGWVFNLILAVGISLTVIMLAMGFIKYITSQGDKTAIEQAQKWVTYAAIGGVGLFLVYAMKTVLLNLVGLGSTDVTGTGTTI